jgi:hypothetical protein
MSARGQRKHDAEQARLIREADEADAEQARAQIAAEREAAVASELQRPQKIDSWRESLRAATEAENEWRMNDYGDILRPNLIGLPRFEETVGDVQLRDGSPC